MVDALLPRYEILANHAPHLGGLWGRRLADTVERWMLHVSEDALLDGFRQRPGVQPWIGEHLGKYLLGAVGAAAFVPQAALAARLERLVTAWVACQEPDGYLGTYLPAERWQPGDPQRPAQAPCWDLWVHKYAILGLLAYAERTGWAPALAAARRAGDLVAAEFGPGSPRDLNRTDEHAGLASGSILEAILLLHRRTGATAYLELARRIVTDFWERPDGPRLMAGLRAGAPVHTIGDGKAYEMMSCFVGLAEYARTTGDRGLLDLLLAARDRIAAQVRYPTGGMSDVEWFKEPGRLREEAPLETCVSFTWLQWNLRLFALSGDPAALDLAEEVAWNQLLPAVCPDGSTWTYHLPITGPKIFSRQWIQGVEGRYGGASLSCCHTNGQRALALFPRWAYSAGAPGELAVNFYGESGGVFDVPGTGRVHVRQSTDYPASGIVELEVSVAAGRSLVLALRVPGWAGGLRVEGADRATAADRRVRLAVAGNRRLRVELPMEPRLVAAGGSNRGKVALARGPLLFALDPEQAPPGWELDQVALALDARLPPAAVQVGSGAGGWPVLRVPVARLPTGVVAPAAALARCDRSEAAFEPILFAGLGGRPRGEEPDRAGAPWDAADTAALPTYRTLFPWLPD